MADKTQQQIDEQRRLDEQRLADERRAADERRLEALRDEERRHEDEHQKWMKDHPLDPYDARRLEERVEADERRVEALRGHPDPEVRAIGEKIWEERDREQAAAEEEWEADGGDAENARAMEREARRARIREAAEPDPGWLARWEREGTLSPLTPQEREKLRAIDREDPFGREQRAMFLPREVLAIRSRSDRLVEEREAQQLDRPESGEHKQEPGKVQDQARQAPELEQDQDDELELE